MEILYYPKVSHMMKLSTLVYIYRNKWDKSAFCAMRNVKERAVGVIKAQPFFGSAN